MKAGGSRHSVSAITQRVPHPSRRTMRPPYLAPAVRFTLRTYVTLASGFGDHLLELGQECAAKHVCSEENKHEGITKIALPIGLDVTYHFEVDTGISRTPVAIVASIAKYSAVFSNESAEASVAHPRSTKTCSSNSRNSCKSVCKSAKANILAFGNDHCVLILKCASCTREDLAVAP